MALLNMYLLFFAVLRFDNGLANHGAELTGCEAYVCLLFVYMAISESAKGSMQQ